jgi:transcriptional regulator with XRE-family HTH domain
MAVDRFDAVEAILRHRGQSMSERHAFGPNLRRIRLQRGISLSQLAAATKVSIDLWSGLERNDLSRWPIGIYARSYVRAYATHIGLDPETTVDDFCRMFPQGDRRAERLVREQAALVGHDLHWKTDLVTSVAEDRRVESITRSELPDLSISFAQRIRIGAAVADAIVVAACAACVAMIPPISFAAAVAGCAIVYHAVALVALGCTPAVWTFDTYISHRQPGTARAAAHRFLRFPRRSNSQV